MAQWRAVLIIDNEDPDANESSMGNLLSEVCYDVHNFHPWAFAEVDELERMDD